MRPTTDVSVISYPVAESEIKEKSERYSDLTIGGPDDKEGYRMVRAARIDMKNDRVAVENRRKELKAGALEFGKKVDSAANHLKSMISQVENELKEKEEAHQRELERIKQEEERKRKEAIDKRMRKLIDVDGVQSVSVVENWTDDEFQAALNKATAEKKTKDIEAEKIRKQEEAERIQRQKEQEEEEKKLAAERAELAKQQEQQRLEQERIDSERRAVEEACREAEEKERIRIAEINAAEAERKAIQQRQEEEAREKARQEAMKPDIEKILGIAEQVMGLIDSVSVSTESLPMLQRVNKRLYGCAEMIKKEVQL